MQQSVATGIFKYLKLRLFVIGREECGVFGQTLKDNSRSSLMQCQLLLNPTSEVKLVN